MELNTKDLVRILQLKKMGRRTAKKLCDFSYQGLSSNLEDIIFEISSKKLISRFPDYSRDEINKASNLGDQILEKSEVEKITITSFYDEKFPRSLLTIEDPPILINTKGKLENVLAMPAVAVIGTREPSSGGILAGEYFGKQLAKNKINVVSGLAKGCDAAGHRGCLSVNGITTAILAHGLHTIYPKENRELAEEIIDKGGVLLSEYFLGVGALANYFVERDRLQAGLSIGTIVIQTAEKGGTMHAVKATLSGRKVLAAIKYKDQELEYPKTAGNELLIREGKAFGLTSDNFSVFLYNLSKAAAGVSQWQGTVNAFEDSLSLQQLGNESTQSMTRSSEMSDPKGSCHTDELPDRMQVRLSSDSNKQKMENINAQTKMNLS